jgi:hypothetical protein
MTVVGPVTAIGAALGGLRRAGSQAADAAQRIVAAGARPADPLPFGVPETPDLGRAAVDLVAARQAYAANAAVVRTADAMEGELVRRMA